MLERGCMLLPQHTKPSHSKDKMKDKSITTRPRVSESHTNDSTNNRQLYFLSCDYVVPNSYREFSIMQRFISL